MIMASRSIAILGYDANTPEVLRTAVALGFTPTCIHAPNGALTAGTKITVSRGEVEAIDGGRSFPMAGDSLEIDVLAAAEFQSAIVERNIPVVIGSYGLRERDYFRENLLYGRNKLNLSGPILHPAFLGDFHSNPKRRYAIIGFPGSGNMILQHICSRLMPPPPAPIWAADPLSAAVSQFALCYWYSLGNYLASQFDDVGRWHDVAAPSHLRYGAIYIALRNQISPAVIAGLPQRSYIWSNPWHTSHEPLTDKALSFFSEQNIRVLQIVRHPLDLIVSNAAKITAAAGDRAPQLLLQVDTWMEGMLQTIEAYYAAMVKHRQAKGVTFLQYADLLADPIVTIRRVADFLDVDVNDQESEVIWSDLKGSRLSGEGHFWDPRSGKWREFIPLRFAERIIGSPLHEYAKSFGFDFSEKDFIGSRADVQSYAADLFNIAWQDARWESSTGKQPAISHPDVYRAHDQELGLLMVCGKNYAPVMENLRMSPVLRDILAASKASSWHEAALMAPYLGLKVSIN